MSTTIKAWPLCATALQAASNSDQISNSNTWRVDHANGKPLIPFKSSAVLEVSLKVCSLFQCTDYYARFRTLNNTRRKEKIQTHHSCRKAGLRRVVATILAPWLGGFEYMVRTISSTWLRHLERALASLNTRIIFPVRSSANVTRDTFRPKALVYFAKKTNASRKWFLN